MNHWNKDPVIKQPVWLMESLSFFFRGSIFQGPLIQLYFLIGFQTAKMASA